MKAAWFQLQMSERNLNTFAVYIRRAISAEVPCGIYGVLAGDKAMSGSGKLKVASMPRAVEGVKLPLIP